MAFRRYVALVRARRGVLNVVDELPHAAASVVGTLPVSDAATVAEPDKEKQQARRRKQRRWSPLEQFPIPHRTAADGCKTLDGSLDIMAYQWFRDGLLAPRDPPSLTTKTSNDAVSELESLVLDDMTCPKTMDAAADDDAIVRRSIAETALTIGCDEAGRGPLAGPLVGAAVCRVPLRSLTWPPDVSTNDKKVLSPELFPMIDSKVMSEVQRRFNFQRLTGHASLEALAASLGPEDVIVERLSASPAPPAGRSGPEANGDPATTVPPQYPFIEPAVKTPLADSLECLMEKRDTCPSVSDLLRRGGVRVTLRGVAQDTVYRYYWSITAVDHALVDRENVFASSMRCMHESAVQVWRLLSTPATPPHGRHRPSPAAVLCRRMKYISHSVDKLHPQSALPDDCQSLSHSGCTLFGSEELQPPLVLVDGSHAPLASRQYFSDIEVGGDAQSVVKGDGRSWSIAAASNLAKFARDSLMKELHDRYPLYGFNRHHGYPVAEHFRAIKKHGLSHVHRLSYKPCAEAAGIDLSSTKKRAKSVVVSAVDGAPLKRRGQRVKSSDVAALQKAGNDKAAKQEKRLTKGKAVTPESKPSPHKSTKRRKLTV